MASGMVTRSTGMRCGLRRVGFSHVSCSKIPALAIFTEICAGCATCAANAQLAVGRRVRRNIVGIGSTMRLQCAAPICEYHGPRDSIGACSCCSSGTGLWPIAFFGLRQTWDYVISS